MTNSSLFVILDNSPGRIDAGQMSWVKKTLASAADAEHIFLFMHQPIISWPQGPARRAEKRHRKLLRLIKENHVDAVFMGHWHGYHSESRDRVRFVVNGRGVDFDWNSWYSPVPAYATTVKVNGEKVAIGKIEIEGRLLPLFTGQLETFLFVYLHPLIVEHRLLSLLFLFGLAAAATILFLRMRRGPGSTSSQI